MCKWKKYTKKPITIEAYKTDKEVSIDTLEGTMIANKGDYIIKGVEGEIYPCKPEIFKKTYDEKNLLTFSMNRPFKINENTFKTVNDINNFGFKLAELMQIFFGSKINVKYEEYDFYINHTKYKIGTDLSHKEYGKFEHINYLFTGNTYEFQNMEEVSDALEEFNKFMTSSFFDPNNYVYLKEYSYLKKLEKISELTHRNKSSMIEYLIDREYDKLKW